MKREDFPDLMVFATIARERSFARAAAKMNLTSSALSHIVGLLEGRLEIRLLNRMTRSVSPTPAGERLLAALEPALADISQSLETLAEERDRPAGVVRLNSHRSAALLHVTPRLDAMVRNTLTWCST